NIIFLYNGFETLGMIKENNYKKWLLEYGLKLNVLKSAIFYDKGYAFFRYCMDSSIDEKVIVSFVTFLFKNKIYDSRDMTPSLWNKYFKEGIKGKNEIKIRHL